ncbi:MAG: F0F1 ATP synthase subunit B [Gammaproteobacteria bacterium]|nr:F0F1 ATP synthase subunit B [Gammaproteobacteria bacterium]
MNINITLIVQMLVFLTFVWFTMRFVWPPLSKAMEERRDKIADGLAAAERGRKELELAQRRARDEVKQAKSKAGEIIEKANHRAAELIEEAKIEAKQQAGYQAKLMKEQLVQEVNQARTSLRQEVASLVVAGAEKIIRREVDKKASAELIDALIEEF